MTSSTLRSSTAVPRGGPGRRAARGLEILCLLGLVAALALVGTTGYRSSSSEVPPSGAASSAGALASEPARSGAAATPRALAGVRPGGSADCAALATGWAALDTDRPAPAIAPGLESPCTLDPDVAGLYFLSNVTGSGARAELGISLPANGSGSERDYSAFWLGMWVAGIGCSYAAASYLTVELIPPFSAAAGVAGEPYWTVEAPVWDLVPAGSCDPQCQNDTAFFTISGRGYCEDDAVTYGFGALGPAGHGAIDPGDHLAVTFNGAVGSATPLEVYLNDTTHPAESLAWNYSGTLDVGDTIVNATVTGEPLVPLEENATAGPAGWTGGLDLGFGWYGCPEPTGGDSYASACVTQAEA